MKLEFGLLFCLLLCFVNLVIRFVEFDFFLGLFCVVVVVWVFWVVKGKIVGLGGGV